MKWAWWLFGVPLALFWLRSVIDAAFGMGLVGYHLIQFSREALRGEQNASFYSTCRKPSLGRI